MGELKSMGKVIYQAESITAGYGRNIVLKDLSLSIEAGSCSVVVGPNGCGKSTLFSVLAGLKKVKSGRLLIDGEEAGEKQVYRLTGYVPQSSPLYEELTVRDNLLLWYGEKNILEKELEEGFLYRLGLQEILKKRAGTLSGGMARRVCIGCALAGKPRILVMDEPGAALDLECKMILHGCLKEYQKTGGSIVLSSHDEADLTLADRLYVLRNGQLYEEDKNLRGNDLLEKFGMGKHKQEVIWKNVKKLS